MNEFEKQALVQLIRIADSLEKLARCTTRFDPNDDDPDAMLEFNTNSQVWQPSEHIWDVNT